jgi:hypothetical protein
MMAGPQNNPLTRIDPVWMALSVDDDGTEGLCAVQIDGTWMPLVAADEMRLAFIRAQAEIIARQQQRLVRIVRLGERAAGDRWPPMTVPRGIMKLATYAILVMTLFNTVMLSASAAKCSRSTPSRS